MEVSGIPARSVRRHGDDQVVVGEAPAQIRRGRVGEQSVQQVYVGGQERVSRRSVAELGRQVVRTAEHRHYLGAAGGLPLFSQVVDYIGQG